VVWLLVVTSLGLSACVEQDRLRNEALSGTPIAHPVSVCGRQSPVSTRAPVNAVVVDPSIVADLSAKTTAHPPGTTFWLAAGTHRLVDDRYGQVRPKDGNTYLGAQGAVLDGRGMNRYAFTGLATNVTIKDLAVRGFVPPVNEGVVNHDSGAGWVIEGNTLIDNRGAALMVGARQIVRGNCIKDNGQYGLNACCGTLGQIQIVGNEFVGNNADDLESRIKGCGCSGAMKFWRVNGADVRANWIHDNHGPGIWADTGNNDFVIESNLVEGNDGPAIFYEASYNAIIRHNLLRRNNLVQGKEFVARKSNFPTAAVYVSESGGEPRIPARTALIDIYGNVLEDNWSGITLWENADRFCNSPANTSSGVCTLLVKNMTECRRPAIASAPLFADCRWRTKNVSIHGNRFSVDPATLHCADRCAQMALLSNYGTFPAWSPYKGDVVQKAITFAQQNRWYDNTYLGPWRFVAFDATGHLAWDAWRRAPYRQDRGSTLTSSTAPTHSDATGTGSETRGGDRPPADRPLSPGPTDIE
jgi:hypothetical protein